MGKLEELLDIEEIKNLRAKYCFLTDIAKDFDAVMDLFTKECSVDFHILGAYPNREALAMFYKAVATRLTFSAHMLMNPIIRVTGDSATGEWYLTCHATLEGKQATLLLAHVFDTYEREEGVWKIKSIKYNFKYNTTYEDGWAKTPFIQA